jgi:hypothetical protein
VALNQTRPSNFDDPAAAFGASMIYPMLKGAFWVGLGAPLIVRALPWRRVWHVVPVSESK